MGELLFLMGIIVVIAILVMEHVNTPKFIPKPLPPIYYQKKPKKKSKPKIDPNVVEAKKRLVTFGYTATEAKKMLEGMTAKSVDDYVNQALKKVKI